jgi:hypothetical protein
MQKRQASPARIAVTSINKRFYLSGSLSEDYIDFNFAIHLLASSFNLYILPNHTELWKAYVRQYSELCEAGWKFIYLLFLLFKPDLKKLIF